MAKRILIADDSLTIQKAFAMTFAGEDVTLFAARSADEGLTLARQAHPELVIADGLMPGRSGYDLCTAIKTDPGLRGVPVYILTSSQNPYDEVRGRESGADGQLTKPFETTALMERVNEAIAKGASAAPALAIVQAGPAQIPGQIPSDDDYGEITVEPSGPSETTGPQEITGPHEFAHPNIAPAPAARVSDSEVTPPPRVPLAAPARPAAAPVQPLAPVLAPAAPPGGLRPSLIPGLRPGAVPAARPGSSPVRPVGLPGSTPHIPAAAPPAAPLATGYARPGSPAPAARGPAAPASPLSASPARTLMGLPAALAQPPARAPAPISPARPVTQPIQPIDTRPLHPFAPAQTPAPSLSNPSLAGVVQTVQSKVDQKVAEISARGPEYEAIAKLSREIIERIVWEVVPELTEVIVREELQKRGRL